MLEKNQWIIHQADIDRYKGMIRQENRTAFRLMTVTGCVLSVFNLITQIVVSGFGMPIFRSSILLVCFSLLFFLDRIIIPEDVPLLARAFARDLHGEDAPDALATVRWASWPDGLFSLLCFRRA